MVFKVILETLCFIMYKLDVDQNDIRTFFRTMNIYHSFQVPIQIAKWLLGR